MPLRNITIFYSIKFLFIMFAILSIHEILFLCSLQLLPLHWLLWQKNLHLTQFNHSLLVWLKSCLLSLSLPPILILSSFTLLVAFLFYFTLQFHSMCALRSQYTVVYINMSLQVQYRRYVSYFIPGNDNFR